jgi:hypothetical protein
MRVPTELKARWVRESRAAGMRLTDWIVQRVERKEITMTRSIYVGRDGVIISADLDQASAPIMYSVDGGETWRPTPYQTADCRHDAKMLAELVDDLLESEA